MTIENNTVRKDNPRFIHYIEKIENLGSNLFIDEKVNSSQSIKNNSRMFEEIIKLWFYLSVPTKSNFVFQKKKFMCFVFLFSFIVKIGRAHV